MSDAMTPTPEEPIDNPIKAGSIVKITQINGAIEVEVDGRKLEGEERQLVLDQHFPTIWAGALGGATGKFSDDFSRPVGAALDETYWANDPPEEPIRYPDDIRRIAELREAVEKAYKEGYYDGNHDGKYDYNDPGDCWHHSAARALLGENDGK